MAKNSKDSVGEQQKEMPKKEMGTTKRNGGSK